MTIQNNLQDFSIGFEKLPHIPYEFKTVRDNYYVFL